MEPFLVTTSMGICAPYFHAVSLGDNTNIFTKNAGSIMLKTAVDYPNQIDVTERIIKQLLTNSVIVEDGNDLLIKIQGQLVVPDTDPNPKWPLLLIHHGQHNPEKPSYQGYKEFQQLLAASGIASYSIDLTYPNLLQNNEDDAFKTLALDNNQRILLSFLHFKLLKMMAGEAVNEPTANPLSIKISDGTNLRNLKDVVADSALLSSLNLSEFKGKVSGKLDFTKIGVMGHSRGADTVSRIPAYLFKGSSAGSPTYPINTEVDRRIKNLVVQVGQPTQDIIKSILALEPVAAKGPDSPSGYVIDNPQTIFFLGLGTDDEDVTLDSIRLYEYPTCPKVMVVINGASHKRFNTVWADDPGSKGEFDGDSDPPNLLSKPKHVKVLQVVFGPCFTGTLTGSASDLEYFTKHKPYPVNLPGRVDVQSSWSFGFPLQSTGNPPNIFHVTATGISSEQLESPPFKQEITASYGEKDDAATIIFNIPVHTNSHDDLSKHTHFSFRFAKSFDLRTEESRIVEKNFIIQFFSHDTRVGKAISGNDIKTLELKALDAYHRDGGNRSLDYFILLQTVEIFLSDHFTDQQRTSIDRIEIDILPEPKGPTPVEHIVGWSIVGTVAGFAIGFGGVLAYDKKVSSLGEHALRDELIGGGIGALVLGGLVLLYELKPFKNGFAFDNFQLTDRTIPQHNP